MVALAQAMAQKNNFQRDQKREILLQIYTAFCLKPLYATKLFKNKLQKDKDKTNLLLNNEVSDWRKDVYCKMLLPFIFKGRRTHS